MAAQSTQSILLAGGSNGTVSLGTGVPSSSHMTVSAWIKLTSLTAFAQIVCRDNSLRQYQFRINSSNKLELVLFISGSAITCAGSTALSTGTWYHVAATQDGTNAYVYLNGVQDGTIAAAGNLDSAAGDDTFIGTRQGNTLPLDGRIDDVAFIGSALTSGQIANIHAGTLDVSTLSPTGLWRMEEGAGSTTADTSGNGNTGTLSGGATWSSDVPLPLQGGIRFDDFNRSDSSSSLGTPSDGGSAWTAQAGTWGISTNKAYCPSGSGIVGLDSGTADVDVQATLSQSGAANDCGVAGRIGDANNLLFLRRNAGAYDLYKLVAGSFTGLFTGVGTYADGDVVKLSMSGSTIKAYVNGVQIGTTQTVTDLVTNTQHGFRDGSGAQGRYDDFSITDASGGTTFTTSPSGSCTASGALTKSVSKALAGSSTATGTLRKAVAKPLAGSLTGAGTLAKATAKALAGSTTGAGVLTRAASKAVAGSCTAVGTIGKAMSKPLAGSTTAAGAMTKQANKALAGSSTAAGTLATTSVKLLSVAGSCTATGTAARAIAKSLFGSITVSAVLSNASQKAFVGSVTPSASLTKQAQKPLAGSSTPTGSITRVAAKGLAGSVAASAALTKASQKSLAGNLTPIATLAKHAQKPLAGSTTTTGSLAATRVVLISLAGSVTPGSTLTKAVAKLLASSVTVSGALSTVGGSVVVLVYGPVVFDIGTLLNDSHAAFQVFIPGTQNGHVQPGSF